MVLGYYAISSHGDRRADLPDDQAKGLPRIDMPVILLGRLAVHQSVRGQGLGSLLLIDALKRSEDLAQQVGIRAFVSGPPRLGPPSLGYRFCTCGGFPSTRLLFAPWNLAKSPGDASLG
jgi:GNAT superfamily N-acetyltransferase